MSMRTANLIRKREDIYFQSSVQFARDSMSEIAVAKRSGI
jgi:hypothetical protein